MRLKAVTLKAVIGIVVLLSVLSGVALARRGERVDVIPRHDGQASLVAGGHQHGSTRTELKVAVDGGKTPELISDDAAYQLFLAATALSDKQSPNIKKFVRQRIERIGLSRRDALYYEEELHQLRLRDELDRIETEQKSLGEAARANAAVALNRLGSLRLEKMDRLNYAKNRLAAGLSVEGKAILTSYIQSTVKKQIRLFRAEATQPH